MLHSRPGTSRILILLLLLVVSIQAYDLSRATSHQSQDNLADVSLSGIYKILVIAPHPDDETLGVGGLIQVAHDQGIGIKVVVVTNGDGQRLAPVLLGRDLRPRPDNYIALGENRQSETLAAGRKLGLNDRDIYFLGYPDRKLKSLWLENWNSPNCSIRSPYTRALINPYPLTYSRSSDYCGKNLLKDLLSILGDYRPELIILPHPDDQNPDHQAAGSFTMFALSQLITQEPDYHPSTWGYIIHYGYYPLPRKVSLSDALLPPLPLAGKDNSWLRLELIPQQVETKLVALRQHTSQLRLLGGFLTSFARRNEIFIPLRLVETGPIDYDNLSLLNESEFYIPINEPTKESARRLLFGGTDLVGWDVTRLGNSLVLTAETRGHLIPGVDYRILVKYPDGETRTFRKSELIKNNRSFSVWLDLSNAGDPAVLGFSAEAWQRTTLDRTGWYFSILRD